MAGLGLPSPLVSLQPQLPEERGQGSHTCNFYPAHTAELGRLYSFQGESENRNETKYTGERGANTDMRRTEARRMATQHKAKGRGGPPSSGPQGQAHLASSLVRLEEGKPGTPEHPDEARSQY